MPPLVWLGRRWFFAADDVVIPAAVGAAFHVAWTIGLVFTLPSLAAPEGCGDDNRYWQAGAALLVVSALTAAVQLSVLACGLQGAVRCCT